jgi:hypothetical protein
MVRVREITVKEKDYWNKEVRKFDFVHPLNSYAWDRFALCAVIVRFGVTVRTSFSAGKKSDQ